MEDIMLKIRTDQIGLTEPIEVKLTVAKKTMANNVMIHAIKGDLGKPKDSAGSEVDEMVQDNAVMGEMMDFVQTMLGLTKVQRKKVEESIDVDDLTKYTNYLYFKTRGLSDETIDSIMNDTQEDADPKEA
jgi:hypothetical protein